MNRIGLCLWHILVIENSLFLLFFFVLVNSKRPTVIESGHFLGHLSIPLRLDLMSEESTLPVQLLVFAFKLQKNNEQI